MTGISDDLIERMVDFVRDLASAGSASPIFRKAAEIAALLPDPVDQDLIEARKVAADASGGGHDEYANGRWDHSLTVDAAMRGIRRGRELARMEQPR